MKKWLGLVVAGMALVAVWQLPPEAMSWNRGITPSQEEARADALDHEVRRLHGVLVHRRWADSLTALALATDVDGLSWGMPPAPDVPAETIERFRTEITRIEAEVTPRDPDLVLGFYVQASTHGRVRAAPEPIIGGRDTYVGVRDGRAYCLQVEPVPPKYVNEGTLQRLIARSEVTGGPLYNVFGPCRFYAQYGLAGARIQDWLDAGAMGFAARSVDDPVRANLEAERAWRTARVFGLNRSWFAGQTLTVDRCLAGIAEACEEAITDAKLLASPSEDERYVVANSPVASLGTNGFRSAFGEFDDMLLAEIEAEFGPERFARFWTSDREVPQAFEDAFGVGLGEWMVGWVDREMGVYAAGPGIPGSSWWLSMLTISVLGLTAAGIAIRRKVA